MQGQIKPETRSAPSVYAGIDVSKDRLDVYIHPVGCSFDVTNDKCGIKHLRRELMKHQVSGVIIEATGKYHRLAHRSLSQSGIAVSVINPLRARLFAEACGTRAKTDRVDARMLAALGEALAPMATPLAPETLEELQEFVHARYAATVQRTAVKNRLKASRSPALTREFRSILTTIESHIKRLEKHAAKLIASDPVLAQRRDILMSVPGIGPVVAATLIADMPELGTVSRQAAACLAGVAPFADDSGNSEGIRHIKGGRSKPRQALYWAAMSARKYNPDMKTFYDRLVDKGKKKKLALTAVMRKLIILANTLITENRLWQPVRP